jgi:polyisoprenyl-teichoic acid--peptidoglycan teichoic acid transferase
VPVVKSGVMNILVAGKHGSLIDTIILVHLDGGTGTIDMVSIPRDLYYNGRKINHYAMMYGMKEFADVVSEISGYRVDKYLMIDMYAFIDVVDLIGGIDIHLDSAVVDPSYKTLDNGVWGTMHYEPGDYHLGGTEALRLARSRHTSSDFARSERQQNILKALKNKASGLGFGDSATVYDILQTVLNKTESNISLQEAISYYFKYQSYKIGESAVMASWNVLEVPDYITGEDCRAKIAAAEAAGEEKPGCEDQLQAYTLLPREDNWDLIKWFVRQTFE